MQKQSALISGASPSGAGATETIKSRFGDVTVDTGKALVFPRGLLGIPDRFNFALAEFPSEKMRQFTLLQSLDDKDLAFITLPLAADNPIIARDDINQACRDLQIGEPHLALLLIVSVHRMPGKVRLSVNARAPLFIDAERRVGAQYVFQNDSYTIQHYLG